MASPISPTYSSFSVHSPFSSASTASFQNENSPTDSQFENLPSPIDTLNNPVAVYPSGPVSLRMLSPQGGDIALAATYGSDFDYAMMELPDLKKTQVPSLSSFLSTTNNSTHSTLSHFSLLFQATYSPSITRRFFHQGYGHSLRPASCTSVSKTQSTIHRTCFQSPYVPGKIITAPTSRRNRIIFMHSNPLPRQSPTT